MRDEAGWRGMVTTVGGDEKGLFGSGIGGTLRLMMLKMRAQDSPSFYLVLCSIKQS